MTLFERTLLRFLFEGKIKMELTGFDMDGFDKAMHREVRYRLGTIQSIIYDDLEDLSDTEKVAAIKRLFDEEFTL